MWDLDLMSRRLDAEPLDADWQRSIGRGGEEPKGGGEMVERERDELDEDKATTGSKAQDRRQLVFKQNATD